MVRSSGLQILGADYKAGVAVVLGPMESAARLPTLQRPALIVVANDCEEVGLKGARQLHSGALNANYAYSFDGEVPAGELITAAVFKVDLTITVPGKAAHAGLARVV